MKIDFRFGLLLCFIYCSTSWAQSDEPRELRIAKVSAPEINCLSNHDCRVTVRDKVDDFQFLQEDVKGRLQSRTFPQGEDGTLAESLYPYVYRVMVESSTSSSCIYRLDIPGIEPASIDMDGDGIEDDLHFVSRGGIGDVAPSQAFAVDGGISIELGNGVCGQQSTYFIGLYSKKPPSNGKATVYTLGSRSTEVEVVTTTMVNEISEPEISHPVVAAEKPSPLVLNLDKAFYSDGDFVSAELKYRGMNLVGDLHGVLLVSSATNDVEHLVMRSSDSGRSFQSTEENIVSISIGSSSDSHDGMLSTQPGDTIVALHYVNKEEHPEISQSIVSDIALVKGVADSTQSVQVEPRLARWNAEVGGPDERPIGAFVVKGRAPVQLASRELLFWPTDATQLEEFLRYSGGSILNSQARDPAKETNAPEDQVYRIEVDPSRAETALLPQLRKLFGESSDLMVSSNEVSALYSLLLEYKLQGYQVYANVKLDYHAPTTVVENEPERSNLNNTMKRRTLNAAGSMDVCVGDSNCILNVPDLWSYMALWDADEQEIPVAFLDMGFIGRHPDFRTPRSGAPIRECDFEASAGPVCGPGRASSPPTVGNGFTGSRSWHGTGVATIAGGIVNNDWVSSTATAFPGGSAGVGGQVVVPMLYRFGTGSYLFEMGAGITQAVNDGASCINISAGFPCNLQTSVIPDVDLCVPGARGLICAEIFAVLSGAAAIICASAVATSFIPSGSGWRSSHSGPTFI